MSAGALMWICVPLYLIENETFSQDEAIQTPASQFCTHNLDSLFKTGFRYSLAVQAIPYYLVVSRIARVGC